MRSSAGIADQGSTIFANIPTPTGRSINGTSYLVRLRFPPFPIVSINQVQFTRCPGLSIFITTVSPLPFRVLVWVLLFASGALLDQVPLTGRTTDYAAYGWPLVAFVGVGRLASNRLVNSTRVVNPQNASVRPWLSAWLPRSCHDPTASITDKWR